LAGAKGVASDHHAFDDFEGVALENRTIHERARVAFIAIADDVFLIGDLVGRELPLLARRETRTTTATDARG
jgi:predicted membrane-bound spermidine synthase